MRLSKLAIAQIIFLLAVSSSMVQAESVGKLVTKGNKSYFRGDYDGALKLYEKASVKAPESPVLYFNMGDALFMKGDFEKAREYFQKACEKTRDLPFEALSWYNIGNCAFRQAERQKDSDLRKALDYYRESIAFYETALKKDPGLKDAAYNLEVARLVVKDLLDRIKRQEELMKKQQERMQAVLDSLVSLVRAQKEVMDETKKLDAAGSTSRDELKALAESQEGIAEGTRGVQAMLDSLFPDVKPPAVSTADSHLDSATVAQYDAVGEISKGSLKAAMGDEDTSLGYLSKALEDLSSRSSGEERSAERGDGKSAGEGVKAEKKEEKKQGEKKSGRQMGSAPRDETARAILDEEKANRKRRRRALAGGYRPVEKDW